MIVKQTFRILSSFARLTRPMVNKYQDVFELFKDYKNPMQMLEMRNSSISERVRKSVDSKQFDKKLKTRKSKQYIASRILIEATGFSPSTFKQYKLVQNLQGSVTLDQKAQSIPLKYSPQKQNIKFHWSINRKVPLIETYKLDKTTAYIFNLPSEITESEIADALGLVQYQQIKITQCLLGSPAYAIVKFKNQKFISEQVSKDNLTFNYKEHVLELVTEKDSHKLGLERRQLVIKGIQEFATPADFLSTLSKYGRVVHLDFPMQVYKEASVAQIKKIYKKEKYPIKLNIYRKNGTIQTEYYPPFEPSLYEQDILKRKEDQYNRKLKYCEDIDIHQGQQGNIFIQNRGYCVVTFSCQEEAQNCYLQNRFVYKMELKNDQDQFEFDEKHRMALLRHIDNSYIENFLINNPNKEWQQKNKQQDSIFFQSLFMNSVYNNLKRQMYQEVQLSRLYQQHSEDIEQQSQSDLNMHLSYKQFLSEMKNTIGKQLINPLTDKAQTSQYGKSFDQLAEQELFGMRLKQKAKKPRYEVNIDDYIRQSSKMQMIQSTKRRKKKRFSEDDFEQLIEEKQQQQQQNQKLDEDQFSIMHVDDDVEIYPTSDKTRKFELFQAEQARQQAAEQAKQNAAPATTDKGKRKFSTAKTFSTKERPKKYQQKVRSHMRYNKYVRNCINEYMGIFSVKKFEQQFRKSKPSFTNPQSLTWADGTEFITEDEVPRVMQYTTTGQAQKIYEAYVKQNQMAKSLNIDIEEHFLRNFEQNRARAQLMSHDFGFVKEEFEYKGDPAQIQQTLDNLNREAEFGQQFKLVQGKQDSKPKIVKIVKLESIVNIEKLQKYEKQISENISNGTTEIDAQKQKTIQKYFKYLWNGKPAPPQLCQALGVEQNTVIDSQKICQDLYKQFKITKKELENMLNINKFSKEQILNDIRMQLRIANQRKHLQSKKPTDYVRDTSDIKVKDRAGRAVVSKFRQI